MGGRAQTLTPRISEERNSETAPSTSQSPGDNASTSVPRYADATAQAAPLSNSNAIKHSLQTEADSVALREGVGESSAVSPAQTETSTASVSESEVDAAVDTEGNQENAQAETQEGAEAREANEQGGESEEVSTEEEQEQGEEGEEGREDEEAREGEEESPSGTVVMSSESAAAGEASEDAEPVVMLVAMLPRMAPIQAPFVGSPPKQAIERREKIIETTGSPPEWHHARVRQVTQQVTQQARDTQRRMISKIGHLAGETRVSVEMLADEIAVATQEAAAYINGLITNAVKQIKDVTKMEIAHVNNNKAMVGRNVIENRDRVTMAMWQNLREGSDSIQQANEIAQRRYDGKISAAENYFKSIPQDGEVGRLPTEKPSPLKRGERPYLTIDKARAELDTFIDQQSMRIAGGHSWVEHYIKDRAKPVVVARTKSQQERLKGAADERYQRLSAPASRAQFMFTVLGLTVPVSRHHEQDESESVQNNKVQADQQGSAIDRATAAAVETLGEKGAQATEYCENDLRQDLVGNIRKQGRKARKAMLGQAKQAGIGLNTSSVQMAEDYRNLIDRLKDLLEPGKFLDARTKVPQILLARQRIEELSRSHEMVAQTQSDHTLKALTKVKQDQVEALAESAQKSSQGVGDIVTRSAFDMSLFAGQTTGAMREGAEAAFAGAQRYAEGNTRRILSSNDRVRGEAMDQLDDIAANICNSHISSAEQGQFDSLKAFVEDMEKAGKSGKLVGPMLNGEKNLRETAASVNHAMPARDWGTVAAGGAATMMIPGAQLVGAVTIGYYLYETDPEENRVVTLLGGLLWPGALGVEQIFNSKFGNLQDRIRDRLSEPQESRALGTLAGSAVEHAQNAMSGMGQSTEWYDVLGLNREAREALGSGISSEAYAQLQQQDAALIERTRNTILDDLDEHERDVSLAYVDHNRERAVAARTRERIQEGRESARWGWLFSAEEARRRSERARIDALRQMQQQLQTELVIEETDISSERLSGATDRVFREMASLAEGPSGRSARAFTVEEGERAAIEFASQREWALILEASPMLSAVGMGRGGVEMIGMSPEAREYIEALVEARQGDAEDLEAQKSQDRLAVASRAYELSRVEGQTVFGQYAEALSGVPGFDHQQMAESGRFGSLSQTDQTILSDVFENTRLDALDRQIATTRDPDQRRQLQEQRDVEWQRHLRTMQDTARALGAPEDEIGSPEAALEYMENRVGRVFARADTHVSIPEELGFIQEGMGRFLGTTHIPGTTPEGYSHATYGREMVRHGRASLEAGAALATEGWGTHEDLLKRSYRNRSAAERTRARQRWSELYGEDMDVAMGIRDREWDTTDALLMTVSPAAWFAMRGAETSGDTAHELELLDADDGTELGALRVAALRHRQQRIEGTGSLGSFFMEDSVAADNLDGSLDNLANVVLDAAAKGDPDLVASYRANPSAIFRPDGTIDPAIRTHAFSNGEFQGDHTRFDQYSGHIEVDATAYRNELDRYESIITGSITVMAMIVTAAATIIAMFVPGLNAAVVGIAVAIISGATTMMAKAGMRGERYGWEEAATDVAMTAIEAATAGIGGAMGGQLNAGPLSGLARLGTALNSSFGKVGGAMAREAITATISGITQTAIQDDTWKDGFSRGLENMATGGLRNAAVAAVTAGVSEGASNAISDALPSASKVLNQLDDMPPATRGIVTHGREAFVEATSEFLGTAMGESAGLGIDYARGTYKGDLWQSIKIVGGAALRDMASGAIRGASTSFTRSVYNSMMQAARISDAPLSSEHLGLLLHLGRTAGVVDPAQGIDVIRGEVFRGRELLAGLPRDLRPRAAAMGVGELEQLRQFIASADYGEGEARSNFQRMLEASVPGFASKEFMQVLDQTLGVRKAVMEQTAMDVETAQHVRKRLGSAMEADLRHVLEDSSVDGLQHLSETDLARAADMIARGIFDAETADALFASARQNQPDLDEASFLSNLQGAVETARTARELGREIKQRTYAEVMDNLDEQGRQIFSGIGHEDIATLKAMMEAQDMGSPHQQQALFEIARRSNPDLGEIEFKRLIENGIARAAHKQQQLRKAARTQREKHMLNIPEAQRSIISAMPDDALIELRVRQMQGEDLSPAEMQRLIDAAVKETPDVDINALRMALQAAIAHPPLDVSPEQRAKLRDELFAGVPQDQRGLLGDVPILVMRNSEFEAFARSESGQAVTLLVHGRPVVVMRESADPMVLREEGIHVLQSKDPQWASRIGALDERSLADWDKLSLTEQMALYRNKLDIEIDAQHRLIASLESELAHAKDPAELSRLQARLELTEAALGNLMRRSHEVASIGNMHLLAIQAGRMVKPDWIEQPARLFTKGKKQGEIDTEHIPTQRDTKTIREDEERLEREVIARRLAADVSDEVAKNYQGIADKVSLEDLRIIADAASSSEALRGLLSRLSKTEQLGDYASKLAGVFSAMTPEQRRLMAEHWSSTPTKNLSAFVDGLSILRDQLDSDVHLQRLLDATLGTDRQNKNKIQQEHLELMVRVARQLPASDIHDMLAFVRDPVQTRAIIKLADQVDDAQQLVQQFVRLVNSVDGDRLEVVIGWIADRSSKVAIDVIARFDQLRQGVPSEETFRAMIEVVMSAPVHRAAIIDHLIEMTQHLDMHGRRALADLLDKSDKAGRAEILDALLMFHDVTLKRIQKGLDPENTGRLLNQVIEMAATRTQWIVFIDQTLDFLGTLQHLPRSEKNAQAIEKILDYIYQTKTRSTDTPAQREERILQLAADIAAAAKSLREPVMPGSSETVLRELGERNNIILRQVENLEGGDKRLAGKDAWAEHLANEAENWPKIKADPGSRHFAGLMESVKSDWSPGELAAMKPMQAWFEKLAGIHGLDPRSSDPAVIKQLEKLLDTIFAEAFKGVRNVDLKKPARFESVSRVFREMTVRASLAADPKHIAAKEVLKQKALQRMGLTEDSLKGRSDSKNIQDHIDTLVERQLFYERMDALALEIKASPAGIKQNITEVRGEIALTAHMLQTRPDLLLAMPFGKGTGFDQVWVKTDDGTLDGNFTEVIIGEAKGPGAKLGDPAKGAQMSRDWVVATLREMAVSSNKQTRDLARQLIKALQSPTGTKPTFRGIVVEAREKDPGPPPVFEPHDITPDDRGKNGYDFTGVTLPDPELIV